MRKAPMTERDYIGTDPIRWIDRLIEVNAGSQFRELDKDEIRTALLKLQRQLWREVR